MKKLTVLSAFILGAIIAKSQTTTTYTSGVNTWTTPKAVTSITVQCWGGGGAGGIGIGENFSSQVYPGVGGGGGGGGFSEGDGIQVIPGTGYNASVAASSSGNGNSSTFNGSAVIALGGGQGGEGVGGVLTGTAGTGASIGTGTITHTGGNGYIGLGNYYDGAGGGCAGTTQNGGNATSVATGGGAGGVSGGGAGANPAFITSGKEQTGYTGNSPGGGGSGGHSADFGTVNGGNGAAGKITVLWNVPTNVSGLLLSKGSCGGTFTANWTNGNTMDRVVVVSTAPITSLPKDSTTYTANSIYGSGSAIGSNQFVVYNGTGNNVTVTGLGTVTYYVKVFEYNINASNNLPYYLIIGAPTANLLITKSQFTISSTQLNNIYPCNGNNNGSASVSVSGGTTPYTYSWNNGAKTSSVSNLSAGAYTISILDGVGCFLTESISITQPQLLSVSASAGTNVTCNGGTNGSASATATGGTAPYTYSWSNGANGSSLSGLSAGIYSVTVKDINGCNASSSATISQPAVLQLLGPVGTDSVMFTYSASIQNWTVPAGNTSIEIKAAGAAGASPQNNSGMGGQGAQIKGYCNVVQGNVLDIVTGGIGSTENTFSFAGGGGGSFVWDDASTNLFIAAAGGGGGANGTNGGNGGTDLVSNSPTNGSSGFNSPGGSAGNGGSGGTGSSVYGSGGGGAGWFSNGGNGFGSNFAYGGNDRANGFTGGASVYGDAGGFGGGGGGAWGQGGGGGYNGGGGGDDPSGYYSGGGGGSYLNGTVVGTPVANNGGNGYVTIYYAILGAVSSPTVSHNVSCNNGTDGFITIPSVEGGKAPYTYLWSPGGATTASISGLSAGTYSVTVEDANGCSITGSAVITQPALLTSGAYVGNVTCNGGNNGSDIDIVSGGTQPYTYAWSNGATTSNNNNLIAGNYTVTVTDNHGCTSTASTMVDQPVAINPNTSSVSTSCFGSNDGSASSAPTSGISPYTFAWSNGATTSSIGNLSASAYTLNITDNNGCSVSATLNVTQPATLAAPIAAMGVLCNGGNTGSASVTVSGGTAPYTYNWSNGTTKSTVSGLSAGTYTLLVTDSHSCTITSSTIITQPAVVSASITIIDISSCATNNGSATVSVSGGTAPYSYKWGSNTGSKTTVSVSGLSKGTYTVTVTDANSCIGTASSIIIKATNLTATLSVTEILCLGSGSGSESVVAAGGISPYTYNWSTGNTTTSITGLSAGVYSIAVHDASGCSASASKAVTQPNKALTATIGTITEVACNGSSTGTIKGLANGGTSPYTYSWSNTQTNEIATGLSAGIYTVYVTDHNGCSSSDIASVTQPAAISITITQVNVTTLNGTNGSAKATPSGGNNPYKYSWSDSKTTASINGLSAGIYSLTVTDKNGCTATSSVNITQPNHSPQKPGGDSDIVSCCPTLDNITLHPNPNNGQFMVSGLVNGMLIEIYDYSGRRLSSATASEVNMRLNLSNQPNGVYLVRILSKEGKLVSEKKVVKTE